MIKITIGILFQLLGGTLFGAGLLGEGLSQIFAFVKRLTTFIRIGANSLIIIGICIFLTLGLILSIWTGMPATDFNMVRKIIPSPDEITLWGNFQRTLFESKAFRTLVNILIISICGVLSAALVAGISSVMVDILKRDYIRLICLSLGFLFYYFGYLLLS